MTYGERQHLLCKHADHLRTLGLPVTPAVFEDVDRILGASLRAACSAEQPPDPYAAGLERLRADLPPAPRWPETPAPRSTPTDFNPPDPYSAGLDRLRKETR